MPANTQFSIAVHVMAGLGVYRNETITTTDLAVSINTSASFIRRTISKLVKANLVETSTGKGGACRLARNPKDISLLEIYSAVEAPKAFAIHAYPAQKGCKVSSNIKAALGKALDVVQASTEESLAKINLARIIADLARPKA
ncbi:MAG TPA: Rrf2 family transcriptional regulator [Candidatus Methylacidiphilales bacterium]